MILDNKKLEFYNYDGDYKPFLEDVRNRLNEVAEQWTREQKDHCLQETEKSFQASLLPTIMIHRSVEYPSLSLWG